MRQLFVASEQIIHCPVSPVPLCCISVQLSIILITIESVGFVHSIHCHIIHVLYIYPMTSLACSTYTVSDSCTGIVSV